MILLVEDNPDIARIFAAAISEAGYMVEIAMTGTRALECLKARPYRLILLDLSLPDINGAEVAAIAHEAGCTTPMVAVTGAAPLIDKEKLAMAGFAEEPVSKPLRLSALIALVERHAGPSESAK